MKIVDLNNYDENDGLRDKLRQRMDAHEPELSDSVWDRINHQMDRREANRKRRFLWWFSSVAVVLLTSSIFAFMAFNKTEPTTIAQNTNEIIIASPNNPNVTLGTISPKVDEGATPSNQGDIATGKGLTNGTTTVYNNPVPLTPPSPSSIEGNLEGMQDAAPDDEASETKGNTDTENKNTMGDDETPENTEKLEEKNIEVEPTLTKEKEKEVNKKKEKLTAKNNKNANAVDFCGTSKKWFVGLNYSFNRTHRTVKDIETNFFYPNAADRDKLERSGYTSSYGLDFGFYPIKNFFIKSGIGIFNTKEMVKYDVKERENLGQGGASLPDNYEDSITYGTSNIKENTYSYIQIPLEIGYSRCLGNRWGVFVSGGVAYNVLRNYDYYFLEPAYGSEVIEPNSANNYTDMYKNYFMLSGNIGGQYSITKNWVATIGLNYRRAITSSTDKKYAVDVKPYSIGATTGLAFRF